MKIVPNSESVSYGIFSISDIDEYAQKFSTNTGAAPAIVHTHVDWSRDGGQSFITFTDVDPDNAISVVDLSDQVLKQNGVLAVSWDPFAIDFLDPSIYDPSYRVPIGLQSILNGDYDAYIRVVAQQVAQYGEPIMLNLFGEADAAAMFGFGADGNAFRDITEDQTGQYGDPALLDGAERVRDVTKRVIDIFNEEGVTNVTWFQYIGSSFRNNPEEDFHPETLYAGDEYIDWVGASLYASDLADAELTLSKSYNAWSSITNKPYFIPELGMESNTPGLAGDITNLIGQYQNIRAATWAEFLGAQSIYNISLLGSSPGDWTALTGAARGSFQLSIDDGGTSRTITDWRDQTGRSEFDAYTYGTAGADVVEGDLDEDVLVGYAGDDIYVVNTLGDRVIEAANEGYDTVKSSVDFILSDHIEDLFLTGTANISGTGNNLDNTLAGQDGDNLLKGLGGQDLIRGDAGSDTIYGDVGNDSLFGDAGADSLWGGEGIDQIEGGEGGDLLSGGSGDDVLFGNDGVDKLRGDDGADVLNGGAGNDGLFGSSGDDALFGEAGADFLAGEEGNDLLSGGDGFDTIIGANGDDTLSGGEGVDSLSGGAGDDFIFVEFGADTVNGGAGRDFFIISQLNAIAVIEDFNGSEDILDLRVYGLGLLEDFAPISFQRGDDLHISFGSDQLVLEDTVLSDLTYGNVIF